MWSNRIDVRRVVTAIVSRIPEHLRTCEVCLRSQGENRANEPLWERRDKFLFEPFTDGNGVPYIAARVTFNNVPIGWAELMIEAEGYRKMTMKVFVTPDIWCKHDDEKKRWYLLPPREELIRVTELTGELRRAVEQITRQIPQQDGEFHIPGFLWKRVDGYFKLDPDGSRYDPKTIAGYNYGANDPWFDVDEQKVEDPETGIFLGFCGPNNEDPVTLGYSEGCHGALPSHESEPIGEIQLVPIIVAEVKEGDHDLCED